MMWFHLMPYPELPEDFNKKHRSVWVDIDPGLFDRDMMAETYDTYIDQLVYAEECGFDGICVNEHHNNGYGLMPSPNLIALHPRQPHVAGGHHRARQLGGALQPAGARRRGVRHARPVLPRPTDRRLPGRHGDGHRATPTASTPASCARSTTRASI